MCLVGLTSDSWNECRMKKELVFDLYGTINERRKEFLRALLPGLLELCHLRTALDVGCGLGFFSKVLTEMGLEVRAFDARTENVAEARIRYPNVVFRVCDVEDSMVLHLDPADMTLCFGLLYHLENPFRAIRNVHALTSKVAIIESMVAPYRLPYAVMVDEPAHEDQSLRQVAFVASEAGLTKMLYRAGFSIVYRARSLPEHEEFRESLGIRRRRTILVASKMALTLPNLVALREPHMGNVWEKPWGHPVERVVRSLRKRLKWGTHRA